MTYTAVRSAVPKLCDDIDSFCYLALNSSLVENRLGSTAYSSVADMNFGNYGLARSDHITTGISNVISTDILQGNIMVLVTDALIPKYTIHLPPSTITADTPVVVYGFDGTHWFKLVAHSPPKREKSQRLSLLSNSCRCGRASKPGVFCTDSIVSGQRKYSSRCPCRKARRPCTEDCHCIGCGNEYGMHIHVRRTTKTRRNQRRGPRVRLKESLEITKTSHHLSSVGQGHWSVTETAMLHTILDVAKSYTRRGRDLNYYRAHTMYCQAQRCVHCMHTLGTSVLREKSMKKVHAKILYLKQKVYACVTINTGLTF